MPDPKRLTVNLPQSVYTQLQRVSEESERSMTDVVRDALALLAVVHDEEKAGHRLALLDVEGEPIKEFIRIR